MRITHTYPILVLGGYIDCYSPTPVIAGRVPAIESGNNAKLDYPDKPGNYTYGSAFPSP